MNGCDFFDDQPPTGALPRWATITQVSDFLEVSRNAVRSAVRRAVANNEQWVKKETSEEEKPVYLIDTDHEIYKSHEERWKQSKVIQGDSYANSVARWSSARQSLFSHTHCGERTLPPPPFANIPWQEQNGSESGLDRWPRLRQWLYANGVQIFKNILDEDEQADLWQWRWDELEGEGCQDVEEAIVTALQNRFHVYKEELLKQNPAFFEEFTQEEPQRPQRFNFFSRKKEAPPF